MGVGPSSRCGGIDGSGIASPRQLPSHHELSARTLIPRLARFRNDASHLMEIGNASTGNSSYQSINAHQEVIQSLRQNAAGSFCKNSRTTLQLLSTLPTYQQDPDDETSMDQQKSTTSSQDQCSFFQLGQAIGTTIASIWNSFVNGFQYFRDSALPQMANRLNASSAAVPLTASNFNDILGVGSSIASTIPSLSGSAPSSMSETAATAARFGFRVGQ